jgi:hypothetical protein
MLDLDRISDQVPPGTGKIVHLLHQLDDQGEPIVISINGKVDLAVSDDRSFQMLVDLVDRLELLEVLKQAKKDLDEGKGLSMEEVKEQARVKYGISL